MEERIAVYVQLDREVREKMERLAHYHGYRTYNAVVTEAVNALYARHVGDGRLDTRRTIPPIVPNE